VIDKALVNEQVIDVFDAAGIKKPDISILSEEFLLEMKNMEHKNIALEVLKKLLNDEIKTRIKKKLIQGKSLMEMLEVSTKRCKYILNCRQSPDKLLYDIIRRLNYRSAKNAYKLIFLKEFKYYTLKFSDKHDIVMQ
jgi:type I restriction enzyme R subunit